MKRIQRHIRKHGKFVVHHVKKHHKTYFVGGFGIYGLMKTVFLLFSFFTGYGVLGVFAVNVINPISNDNNIKNEKIIDSKKDSDFLLLDDNASETDIYGALSEFFGGGFGKMLTERNINKMEQQLFGDKDNGLSALTKKTKKVTGNGKNKNKDQSKKSKIEVKIQKEIKKAYGKVRFSKDLVRDGRKFKLDGKMRKIISFDGASYVKVGAEDVNTSGAVVVDGGTWDGELKAPVEDDTKIPPLDQKTESFIKTYSVGSDVGLKSDDSFDFELFMLVNEIPGVGSGSELLGKKLNVKKSEDGVSWDTYGTCVVIETGGNYGCFLYSDTLSYFGLTYNWHDNNDFIDQEFWDNNPTSGEIIDAIYGNASDTETAYTQFWPTYTSSTCNISTSNVKIKTTPVDVPANSIYILEPPQGKNFTISSSIDFGDCSALITKDGYVSISKTASVNMLNISSDDHVVVDGLRLFGSGLTSYGIYLNNSNYWTINRTQIINQGSVAFYLNNSDFGLLNASQIYSNQNYGMYFRYDSDYNTFNNIQVFNNGSYGLRIYASNTSIPERNTFNNSQFYNNGGYGMFVYGSSSSYKPIVYLNNVISYNNIYDGFYFNNAISDLHDIGAYNNGDDGIDVNNSSTVTKYDTVQVFNNGGNNIEGTTIAGNSNTYSGLNWGARSTSTIPTFDIEWVTRVENSIGVVGPVNPYSTRGYSGDWQQKNGIATGFDYGNNINKQEIPAYFNPAIGEGLSLVTGLEYSNSNYIGEYPSNACTIPSVTFTDDVAAGPVSSDTIAIDYDGAILKKWDYFSAQDLSHGGCPSLANDYTYTYTGSWIENTTTNNGNYICFYADMGLGFCAVTGVSINDINIAVLGGGPTVSQGYISVGTTGYNNPDYYYDYGSTTIRADIGGSNIDRGTCQYSIDNGTNWSTASEDSSNGYCYKALGNPTNTLNIKFRIINSSNHAYVEGTTMTYNYDNTGPTTPTLQSIINGAQTTDTTPLLNWTDVTDAGIGLADYTLYLDDSAGCTSPTNIYTSISSSQYTLPTLSVGTYYWRVRAYDNFGNVSSYSACEDFEVKLTQVVACSGIPSNAIYYNGTTSYNITQTWNGSSWTPTNTAYYDSTPNSNTCGYECDDHYTRDGNSCELDTQIVACHSLPDNAHFYGDVTSYNITQTWSFGPPEGWVPTSGAYYDDNTPDQYTCEYACNSNFVWVGSWNLNLGAITLGQMSFHSQMDSEGNVWIAYRGEGNKVQVKKVSFTGQLLNSWTGLSTSTSVTWIGLRLNIDDEPYLFYGDSATSTKYVKELSGGNWVQIRTIPGGLGRFLVDYEKNIYLLQLDATDTLESWEIRDYDTMTWTSGDFPTHIEDGGLFMDKKGRAILLGVADFYRYENGSWIRYDHGQPFDQVPIQGVFDDLGGSYGIMDCGGKLCVTYLSDTGVITNWRMNGSNGLPDIDAEYARVMGTIDSNGNLRVTNTEGNFGVAKYDGNSWTYSGSLTAYGTIDHHPAIWESKLGGIWALSESLGQDNIYGAHLQSGVWETDILVSENGIDPVSSLQPLINPNGDVMIGYVDDSGNYVLTTPEEGCSPEQALAACSTIPTANAVFVNGSTSYSINQTWNGTTRAPSTGSYYQDGELIWNTCEYKCIYGYERDGDSCEPTPPTVSAGYISVGNTGSKGLDLYYNGTVTIRADVSDDLALDTSSCMYNIGGGWLTATYNGSDTAGYCSVSGLNPQDDIDVQFKISDQADTVTTGAVGAYIYDATGPSAPANDFDINNGSGYTNTGIVTLNLGGLPDDNGGIGYSGIYISNDPNPDSGDTYYNFDTPDDDYYPWTLAAGTGTRTVYIAGVDKLGNIGTVFSDNIIVNTKAPTTTINPNGVLCTSGDILDIELSCTPNGAPCGDSHYNIVSLTIACPNETIPYPTYNTTNKIDIIGVAGALTYKNVCYYSYDTAGNKEDHNLSSPYRIDKQGPDAPTLSTPGDGSTTGDTTPLLSWSTVSSDNGCSTVGTYRYEVYSGSNCNGTLHDGGAVSAPNTSYSLPAGSALWDGSWSWRVKTQDALGNYGPYSNCNNFTVSTNNPPLVGQAEIYDGDYYGERAGTYFYKGEVDIRATASDDNGVTSCDYMTGGSWNIGGGSYGVGYCVKNNLTPTASSITINLRAHDANGESTAGTSRTYVRDVTAPSYGSRNNPSAGSWYTDGSVVSVDIPVTESGIGISNNKTCNVKIDGGTSTFAGSVTYSTSTNKCTGNITLNSNLSDGAHNITVSVADDFDNQQTSSSRSINFDDSVPSAPTLTCTHFTNNVRGNYASTITCSITDTASPSARTAVAYSTNGGGNWTDNSNNLSFNFNPTVGTTNVIMRISDLGGGPTNSNTYIIKKDTSDPSTNITINGLTCTGGTVDTTISCTDTPSGCDGVYKAVINDGQSCGGYSWDSSAPYNVTIAGSAGNYVQKRVCYYGKDNAGNIESATQSSIFNIDMADPGKAGLVSPINSVEIQDDTPLLNWNAASDVGCGIDDYDVYVYNGSSCGGGSIRSNTNISSTSWAVSPALGDGIYSWNVLSRDDAGNTNTSNCEDFEVNIAQTSACVGIVSNAVYYNGATSYNVDQTWNGTTRSPSTGATYDATPITNTCEYRCADDYERDGDSCEPTPPEVGHAYIYVGNTGFNSPYYYYSGQISIRALANDTGGIISCEYTINNGANWSAADGFDGTYCYENNITPAADIVVNFRAYDTVGTVGTGSSQLYKVDGQGPTFTFANANSNENTAGSLSVTSASDGGIGLDANSYNFSTNGSTWQGWTSNGTYSLGTEIEPTNTTIWVRVRDEFGNESTDTATYTWNNVAPTANNVSNSANEGSSVLLTSSVSDPGGTTYSYQWYSDSSCTTIIGGATSSTYTAPAQNDPTTIVYSYRVYDAQGLYDCATATATWNNVNPTVSLSNNGPQSENTQITWTAVGSDAGGGGSFEYKFHLDSCAGTVVKDWSSSNTYSYTMTDPGTRNIYVEVRDGDGGTSTCDDSIGTWTNVVPICNDVSVSTGEASTGTVTANCSDEGGGSVTAYWYTNTSCSSTQDDIGTTWSKYSQDNQTLNYSYRAWDGDGRSICKDATFIWTNRLPTASNFVGHSSVGNIARTVDWKVGSSASDPATTADPLTASVISQGTKGSCSIDGDDITYTPNASQNGDDTCDIRISDGDGGTVDVTVTWQNIDTLAPTGAPICTASQWFNGSLALTCAPGAGGTKVKYTTGSSSYPSDPNSSSTTRSNHSITVTNYLKAISCDALDNCNTSLVTSRLYQADNTGPETIISDTNPNRRNTNVTYTLNATDAGVGMGTIYFKVKDGAGQTCDPTGYGTYSSQQTISVTEGNTAQKTVCFYGVDSLGNIETPTNSQTYKIDKSDPTVSAPVLYGGNYNGNYFNGSVDIKSILSDIGAGIAGSSCERNIYIGSSWLGWTSTDQNGLTECRYISYNPTQNFSIKFMVYDGAGNTGESVQSDFIYDNTAPSVGVPEIYVGNTYNNTYYNGTISIRSSVSDAGSSLDTSSCEYTTNNGSQWSGGTYSASYCIQNSIVPNSNISIKFRILDQLGNTGTSSTKSYTYDNTAPATTDGSDTSWHNTNQTITLSSTDNAGGAGVDYTEYCVYDDGGSACTPSTQGTNVSVTCGAGQVCEKIVRYRSVDNLGNTETIKSSNVVKIDKSAPTTSINPNGAICTASDVSGITISCNDGDGAGCSSRQYKIVTIGTTCDTSGLSTYTAAFDITSSAGTYYQRKVCYRGVDTQGNAEDINISSNYNIDKIGPTVPNQTSPAAGYVDTTTPTLVWGTVGDQGCSTLSGYDVEVHTNSSCSSLQQSTSTTSTSYTTTTLNDGNTYYWRVRGVDNLGNEGGWSDCRQLSIDISGPTGTIEINNDDDYTNDPNTTLTLSANDTNGVDYMQFSCDNSNWTSRETYSTTRSNFNITNGVTGCTTSQGSKNVSVRFKDGLGNIGSYYSDTIIYDIIDPVVSATNSSSTWKNSNISITLTATDNINLVSAKYRWDNSDCVNGGSNYTNGQTINLSTEGNHTLYLCGEDGAGNTDTWNGTYKLDKTDPVANFLNNVAQGPVLSDVISISGTDAGGSNLITLKRKYNGSSQSCSTDGATYPNTNTSWTEVDESNNDDYICIYAEDGAGNYDTLASAHDINIDITAPTGAPVCTPEGYWFSGSTVAINCTPGAGGTVVRYTTDGNTPTGSSSEWLSSQSFGSTITLKAISCDDLNNCNTTAVEIETYTKDNTGPIFTFADNSGLESVGGTLTVAGASDAGTGLHITAPYAFSTDGGNNRGSWTSNNVYSLGIQHEPTSQTIYVKVRDKLGNISIDSAVYTRNNNAPQNITLSNNGPVNEGENITWTAGGVDTGATLSYWWYAGASCSVFLESGATNEYTVGLSNPGDLARSMKVYDSQGSGSVCLTSTGTFNNQVPVCDLVSGSTGEASNLIVSIDCVEPLGGAVTGYWYTNNDCSSTQDYIGNNWTNFSQDNTGLNYSYKGWDGYGFSDCTGVSLIWTNRNPVANNFVGSNTVGNTSSIIVDWKILSSADDPAGLIADPLSAVVQVDGSKGNCSINGDNLTYQVDDNVEGTDSCIIRISDDDGGYVDVVVNWGGLDTILPLVGQAYIYVGNTGYVNPNYYYNGSVDIRASVSDTVGVSACEYTTGTTRSAATYSDPYCIKMGLDPQSNITVNFRATDAVGNFGTGIERTYIYDNTAPSYGRNTPVVNTWYGPNDIVAIDIAMTETGIGILDNFDCDVKIDGAKTSFAGNILYDEAINKCVGNITLNNSLSNGSHNITVQVSDKLGNTLLSPNRAINFDAIVPTVGKAYIYQGSTGQIGNDLFFVPIVNIRAAISDNLGISGNTCEYTLNGITWGDALYTGNVTDGYCYLTEVSNMSDININFRVKDVSDYLTTGESTLYLYDGGMSLLFTGVTPEDNIEIPNLYFTSQIQINKDYLNNFDYIWEGTSYDVYDSGLVLMMNFDNVSALGENATTVKDLSIYNNTGTVVGAIWTGNGKYGGAFDFDGNGDYISIGSGDQYNFGTSEFSVLIWAQTNQAGGVRGLIDKGARFGNGAGRSLSYAGSPTDLYVILGSDTSNMQYRTNLTTWSGFKLLGFTREPDGKVYFINDGQKIYTNHTFNGNVNNDKLLRMGISSHSEAVFNGMLDQPMIYNRALSADEIEFMYNSNLSKYSEDNWLFTTIHDGLDYSTTYEFTGLVSNSVGDVVSTGRSVTTFSPYLFFTGVNPDIGATIPYNRFDTQLHIEKADIQDFDYELDGTRYDLYDSGLVLMANFDNVSALGENATTVKDLSMYNNTGNVVGATWTSNGKFGGAYSFDGSADYIDFNLNIPSTVTISAWAKLLDPAAQDMLWTLDNDNHGPDLWFRGGVIYLNTWDGTGNPICSWPDDVDEWHYYSTIIEDGNMNLYIDGFLCGSADYRNPTSTSFHIASHAGYDWNGLVDNVTIYNRALTQNEIRFMYKSNLSKYSTGDWLFTTTNTCLADDSSYAYTGHVISNEGAEYATGRVVNTDIPDLSITGTIDFDFGSINVEDTIQIITGQYENNIEVHDWLANDDWSMTIQSSSQMSGENTEAFIPGDKFMIKADQLMLYSGFNVDLDYVSIANGLSDYTNVNLLPNDYITRELNINDFMCDAGVYIDRPNLKLEVPSYQAPDTYNGELTVDLVY